MEQYIIPTLALGVAFLGYLLNRDKSKSKQEQIQIENSVKLDNISTATNDIKADIKSINNQISELSKEQVVQSQSLGTAWRKVDDHSNAIKDHETRLIKLEDKIEKYNG